MQGRRGDLQIGVREPPTRKLQVRPNTSVDPRTRQVVGEHRDRGQHPALDVLQVPGQLRRPKGAAVELADDDAARELLASANRPEPLKIAPGRPWPESLRQ